VPEHPRPDADHGEKETGQRQRPRGTVADHERSGGERTGAHRGNRERAAEKYLPFRCRRSAANPVSVMVRTVVVASSTASSRAAAFCRPRAAAVMLHDAAQRLVKTRETPGR
jgi:hypothetical protein